MIGVAGRRSVAAVAAHSVGVRTIRSIPAALVGVIAVLAVAAVVWHLSIGTVGDIRHGLFGPGIDTKVYRGGARAIIDGTPLYAGPVFEIWQFTYPPFAAIAMLPLGLVSPHRAVLAMNAVNVVCLVLLVALTLRGLGFRRDGRFWLATVLAAVAMTALEPVRGTFGNGQINLVLAVLIIGGLTLTRGPWRGIGIGIAAGIKLTPLFFAAYLAVTRQWKALVVAVATFAVTVVIGLAVIPGQAWEFWTVTVHDTSRIGPLAWPANQSFNGFFVRLGALQGLWNAPSWLWLPVGVVVAVVALFASWWAWRCGATMLAITITGMASCAVSPFSWGHHWVWLVPLLLIGLVQAVESARRSRPVTWLWWLAPAAVVVFGLTWPSHKWDGRVSVLQFGMFRLFADPDPHGWRAVAAVIASGSYLLVLLATLAVTLWWCGRRDPIRFNANRSVGAGEPLR